MNSEEPKEPPHFSIFERIDGQLIKETVLKTNRAAGPPGLDAAAWKRLCSLVLPQQSYAKLSLQLPERSAPLTLPLKHWNRW